MPGNEIIGKEEKKHVDEVMSGNHILMRHSFQNLRGDQYKVDELERLVEQKFLIKEIFFSSNTLINKEDTQTTGEILTTLSFKNKESLTGKSFFFIITITI